MARILCQDDFKGHRRLSRMSRMSRRAYTPEEDVIVMNVGWEAAAERLGRTGASVKSRRNKLREEGKRRAKKVLETDARLSSPHNSPDVYTQPWVPKKQKAYPNLARPLWFDDEAQIETRLRAGR